MLEISNTIEMTFSFIDKECEEIKINEIFCNQRLEAYKKMFPFLDCIGWYSVTEHLNKAKV